MDWIALSFMLGLVIIFTYYDWKTTLDQSSKREKIIYVMLMGLAFGLGSLLLVYPDIKGPTDLVNIIFDPTVKLIKE